MEKKIKLFYFFFLSNLTQKKKMKRTQHVYWNMRTTMAERRGSKTLVKQELGLL